MNNPKNQKRSVRVSPFEVDEKSLPKNIIEDARNAVLLAFEKDGRGKSFQVSVVLTSDAIMKDLNKKYLEKDRTTDVLSFPYSTGKFVSADVYVSTARAREQAAEYGHTYAQETLFLVLHGVLHLLGYNDRSERDRNRMWRKQEELLKSLRGVCHSESAVADEESI